MLSNPSSAASVSYAYGYQGWERGGIHWKIGTGTYAPQYIEQTANKDPLYRAGSPSQCSVMAYKTCVPSLGREDALEKEMAPGILAWKIARADEPGRLPFVGSQRAGRT